MPVWQRLTAKSSEILYTLNSQLEELKNGIVSF